MPRRPLLPLLLAASTAACFHTRPLVPSDADRVLARTAIAAEDPAAVGRYAVKSVYYGSPVGHRRPEFRDSAALRTETVDGSAFLEGIDEKALRKRWRWWGFDATRLPVNARVWYPDAPGPFPLVLVVHGNHAMKQFSDPGYAYIGEHLASRGFVVASVDQNFLNGGIRTENDARGWMLLQHLAAWRRLVAPGAGPLAGKADLERVALVGHSRGGEAVAHAALFNRLGRYPDDANTVLGERFGIRALVAIAPVDQQYRPSDKPTPVDGVSYLVLHGSHDGDVSSFAGLRQYQRVRVAGDTTLFKSAVYLYRANHGQFNTTWGDNDLGDGWVGRLALQRRPLLPGDEQRRAGLVFMTAFLEATLAGRREYVPLFEDHRAGGGWLPKTLYVTRYDDGRARVLAGFEEDLDVGTGTLAGVRVAGDSLDTWREAGLRLRGTARPPQDNTAALLGWNRRAAGADSLRQSARRPPAFSVTLDDAARAAAQPGPARSLTLLLADLGEVPRPRRWTRDTMPAPRPARRRSPAAAPADSARLDLTVELVDAAGVRARLALGEFGPVRPPLTVQVYRFARFERREFARPHDVVLQHYALPLARFAAAAPGFDPSRLAEVRLVFDRTAAGTVAVDEIGIR